MTEEILYATTVAELIEALQRMDQNAPVIGHECKPKLVIVEQTTGAVLIAEARELREAGPNPIAA